MKKKAFSCAALILAAAVSVGTAAGCAGKIEYFEYKEYVFSNGESVSNGSPNVTYVLLGNVPEGVSLSPEGVFTVADGVASGTQVLVGMLYDGEIISTCVCTLTADSKKPTVTFLNTSEYIADGESVRAVAEPVYAVTYSLKEEVDGVSVDSVTGKIRFAGQIADGTRFTVVASSHGVVAEKIFVAAIGNLVTVKNSVGITEYGVGGEVDFILDYGSNTLAEEAGVLKVTYGYEEVDSSLYSYDGNGNTLTLKDGFLKTLKLGENSVSIYTVRNTVTVTVKAAQYISTAEELAAINDSAESLAGYYVLINDIDLSGYISTSNPWLPIGTYVEVEEANGYSYIDNSFTGVFDGNGHKITNFYVNRSDVYGYNSGLFGYVAATATIMNLGVEQAKYYGHEVKSYSGGFVGANCGSIINCYTVIDPYAPGCTVVGGFVGRNEGIISCCYSIGKPEVEDGSVCGAFVGRNEGTINYCYALDSRGTTNFCGSDAVNGTNRLFTLEADFIRADFSAWAEGWILSDGEIPQLKSAEIKRVV